jgi:hypothetical protein
VHDNRAQSFFLAPVRLWMLPRAGPVYLYTYYKADIYAYVMVLQNINRELRRQPRSADNRIAEPADDSRE